jgi:TetR/AcrR family transcriptional repressor of nem operon
MARTKEYDRNEVLDTATKVFLTKGFKGTSISDLVSATGLGKRSMYQEFGSKEGLFRECIDNYALKMNSEPDRILNQQPLGLQNIEDYFHMGIDYASSSECPGCMMVNSAIEKELLDDEAFIQVQKHMAQVEESLCQCLTAAQAIGEIAPEKDCRTLAAFLFTFANGMMVRSKISPNKESLAAQVEMALSSIKS